MTTNRFPYKIVIAGVGLFALLLQFYFSISNGDQPAGEPTKKIALVDMVIFGLIIGFVVLYFAYKRIAARQSQEGSSGSQPSPSVATPEITVDDALATTLINKLETFAADKKYLDNADMKQLFHISDKTLYRWRKNGTVPFTNLGGKLVYPKQAVLAILQQRLDNKYDPIHIKPHQKGN